MIRYYLAKLGRVLLGLAMITALLWLCKFDHEEQQALDNAYCSGVEQGLWPEYKQHLGVTCNE